MIGPYLAWFINGLIGVTFVLLGYFTFGNALLFERLFFLCLIFVGFFCRKNVNVLCVVLIIFAGRIMDEAGYHFIIPSDLFIKILCYPALAYFLYRFRHDELSKLAAIIFIACLTSELYWLLIGYQAPEVMWLMFGIIVNTAVRYALIFRMFVIEKFFPGKAEDIMIDFIIRKAAGIHIIISALSAIEYLVRHLSIANPLYIYTSLWLCKPWQLLPCGHFFIRPTSFVFRRF